jgi:methanogenic corrinoid protein MtbC1
MINKTPLYNLMVVLKETGLKADVLRAWERRYDLPHPQRTAGRQRLYSDFDIAIVKWLKSRQAEGLSISRAVQMWKEMLASGHDPLVTASPTKTYESLTLAGETSIESLQAQWLEGCLAFDTVKAEEALNQAFALIPVEKACSTILQHGLKIIGEGWYRGKVTVQQEHFASSMANRRLETLISAVPPPTRLQVVMVGCPLGEMHTFPVLMLSLFLQRAGLKVIYLGADNPIEQMDMTVEAIHPDLVILSAQLLVTAASLSAAARAVWERKVPLAYGGLVFSRIPALRDHIAGVYLGDNLEQAVDKVEELLQSPIPYSQPCSDEKFQALAQRFRNSRSLIERDLVAILHKNGMQMDAIDEANTFFGTKLAAALELGDPAFMEGELDWLDGLLTSHRIPQNQLLSYLAAYNHCLQSVLGDEGAPITGWMERYASNHQQARP